jgi:hypothetical protein
MSIVLKKKDVLVSLENGVVRKEVLAPQKSRYFLLSPEEMVNREIRALTFLEDVEGVQRFLRRDGENVFYSQYIPGKALSDSEPPIQREYFEQLYEIVKKCQERGVYRIGQSRRDFFLTPSGAPAIVDFGNVLFWDDVLAKVPGFVWGIKKYNELRVKALCEEFQNH